MSKIVRPLAFLLLLLAGLTVRAQTTISIWTAGHDLALNEAIVATETAVPNHLVPEWSYGLRALLESTALTVFSPTDHVNSGVNPLEGFSSGVFVGVNVGSTSAIVTNFGFGDNFPIAPLEMDVHPSSANEFAVVRWTAPTPGVYTVSAYWRDIDPHGGNGATGNVVLNGTSIFSTSWANGGAQVATGTLTLTLAAGDKVDFLTGSAGDYTFDSTAFNAVVTSAVPEPGSTALLFVGLGVCALVRRRRT